MIHSFMIERIYFVKIATLIIRLIECSAVALAMIHALVTFVFVINRILVKK